MLRIGIGFLTLFLFIGCSKDKGNTTASSDNETNWSLSALKKKQKQPEDSPWERLDILGNESLVINDSAPAMTRTLSDPNCKITLIYNIRWTTDGMLFEGYSVEGNPRNCTVATLHCPDSYETMSLNAFVFEGYLSDDENILTVTCSPDSNNGVIYKYTYVR